MDAASIGLRGGGQAGAKVTVHVDARGALFDQVGVETLAGKIRGPLLAQIAANRGGANTKARAALNLTV